MSDPVRPPDRSVEGKPTNTMVVTQTDGGLTVDFVDICVVEVGHVSVSRTAKWRDVGTGMTVCDRHRDQYDERRDLGPFVWVPIERAGSGPIREGRDGEPLE